MDIRSPSDSPTDRCCCAASPLGSQGTCSGLAAGSGVGKPRLGAMVPLMISAGHTDTHGDTHRHTYIHRDKCHVQTWTHLCLSEHKWRLRPRVMVRHLGPQSPSPGTLTVPLKKPQHHPPSNPCSNWPIWRSVVSFFLRHQGGEHPSHDPFLHRPTDAGEHPR